ncbi:lysophospholipase [Aureococcus anophagefferens]|nr:lysophospholipase [Aureococcus anophagefferens]
MLPRLTATRAAAVVAAAVVAGVASMAVFVGLRRKRERVEDKKVQSLKITRSPSLATTFRVKTLPQRSAPLSFPGDLEGPVVAPPLAAALRFFAASLRVLDGSTAASREAAAAATWTRYGRGDVVCAAGAPADSALVVAQGVVALSVDGADDVGRLGATESTGHLCALFPSAVRHRTLRAACDNTVVCSVSAASLRALQDADPAGLLRHCERVLSRVYKVATFALERWLEPPLPVRAASIGDDDVLEALAPFGATYSHGCEVFATARRPRRRRAARVAAVAAVGAPAAAVLRAAAMAAEPTVRRWARYGLSRRFLRAGESLCRCGDEADAAYLVLAGRVRCTHFGAKRWHGPGSPRGERAGPKTRSTSRAATTSDVSRGGIVGMREMLTKKPGTRFAMDATCARDTEIVVLPRAAVDALPATGSAALLRRELQRATRRTEPRPSSKVTLASRSARSPFADGEAPSGTCALLDGAGAVAVFGAEAFEDVEELRSKVAAWTAEAEANARVLLVAGDAPTPWSRVAVASADAVVVVALATGAPDGALPRQLLAVVHEARDAAWPKPRRTAAFLKPRPALDEPGHLHCRCASAARFLAADCRRLARFVAGRAVGVVLGGGGAKGLGHLGALRAFESLGIEIDVVGGCSQGAMIGAMLSREDGWPGGGFPGGSEPLAETRRRAGAFADALCDTMTVVKDYNAASTSLSYFGGGAFAGGVVRAVGDFAVEDAWIPFFCVSTDVRTCDVRVHASGDLAPRAVLASMSLVGWPYGWREGLAGARVVARKLRNYVLPVRLRPRLWRVPQLSDISAQLLYIRNSQQLREARDSGDVDFYLRLDSVQRFDLTHYHDIEEIASNAEAEARRDAAHWLMEMKPPKAKRALRRRSKAAARSRTPTLQF